MGSNLVRPVNQWIEIKATAFRQGSVTLRAYKLEHEDEEDEVVYEVANSYTGKNIFSLTRAYAEWIYGACEEHLMLECVGARA